MKQRLFFVTLFLSFIAASVANAQSEVKWTQNLRMTSDTEGVMEFTASIADGWHIYGTDIPSDGPTATEIDFRNLTGMELVGNLTASKSPVTYMDALFNMKISSWEGHVVLSQKFKLKNGSKGCKADGVIAFMSCNDKTCSRPERIPFELSYNESGAVPAGDSVPEKKDNMVAAADTVPLHTPSADKASWWKPVDVKSDTDVHAGWWYIFIWGFVGGLLALLTPCVWPMIPLTVSFFLKKNTSRRRSVLDAVIYGGSIIVIYLTLGIAVTLIFGAGKLNELATNAVFNLIFFGILVLFAVSFFGAFDIKLPAKWSNSVDGRAERTTGLISIFFMAFTLVLVSFSCTGPLIGTLLVEAASQGNIVGPAVGMGAFALALAIPFTLFAIFPSLLKDMPRSGGWLNSVKVVLGFLELILSLKFLSVVDLAYGWRILDREVFIAIWIVLFVLLGLYLLGKLRFSHDAPLDHVSIPRFFLALASLSVSVYLLPGLWGAPLKGVSAFVPPLSTQDFSLYEPGKFTHFDDYDEGMQYAAEHNMPVLLDFSGYGCVNCRKMEGAVLDDPAVKSMIEENFVFITLMVDDRKELPEARTFEVNGQKRVMETVGDLWGYLEEHKFSATVQPFYIVLDNEGVPLTKSMGFTEDPDKLLSWLSKGLENYKK